MLVVARAAARPRCRVDEALEPLGGGGHAQAASALVREADPDAVLERVLSEIERVAQAAAAGAPT